MKRFVLAPRSSLVVGITTSALVGLAVFVFGAPPIILIPAVLGVGTVFYELQSRAMRSTTSAEG
jgi:hypothetical protein